MIHRCYSPSSDLPNRVTGIVSLNGVMPQQLRPQSKGPIVSNDVLALDAPIFERELPAEIDFDGFFGVGDSGLGGKGGCRTAVAGGDGSMHLPCLPPSGR